MPQTQATTNTPQSEPTTTGFVVVRLTTQPNPGGGNGSVFGRVVTNWNVGAFTSSRTQVRMRRNARFRADPLSER